MPSGSSPQDLGNASHLVKSSGINEHIEFLDGLRGIAALAVLFYHGSQIFHHGYIPPSAGLAVDFFYILSGFVLARAYEAPLQSHKIGFADFMRRRLIRLYPMIFLGTTLGVIVYFVGQAHKGHAIEVPAAITMTLGSYVLLPVGFVSGIQDSQGYPFNNPVWSLFWEFVACAIFAGRVRRMSNAQVLGVMAISAIGLLVAMRLFHNQPLYEIGFSNAPSFSFGIFRVSYSFWAGVLISRVGGRPTIRNIPPILIVVALVIFLLSPADGNLYSALMVGLVFPFIMISSIRVRLGRKSSRICLLAGELSYPIYLIHQPIFRLVQGLFAIIHVGPSSVLCLLTGSAFSMVLSWLALVKYERPLRGYFTRLLRERVATQSGQLRLAPIGGDPGVTAITNAVARQYRGANERSSDCPGRSA